MSEQFCGHCDGNGFIRKAGSAGRIECPRCNGEGVYNGEDDVGKKPLLKRWEIIDREMRSAHACVNKYILGGDSK